MFFLFCILVALTHDQRTHTRPLWNFPDMDSSWHVPDISLGGWQEKFRKGTRATDSDVWWISGKCPDSSARLKAATDIENLQMQTTSVSASVCWCWHIRISDKSKKASFSKLLRAPHLNFVPYGCICYTSPIINSDFPPICRPSAHHVQRVNVLLISLCQNFLTLQEKSSTCASESNESLTVSMLTLCLCAQQTSAAAQSGLGSHTVEESLRYLHGRCQRTWDHLKGFAGLYSCVSVEPWAE